MTRRQFIGRAAGAGVTAAGVGALLAACSSSSSPSAVTSSGAPRYGGRIRSGHVGSGTAEVLDPAKQLSPIDSARALNLFDGLTWPRPDGTIEYRLAESMTPNADATSWQIKLRPGVTFHNGKPLTADDVLYTFHRNIKGGLTGAVILSQVDLARTRKLGKYDLQVALTHGVAEFPRYVSTHLLMITQAGEEKFNPPVGTGPFQFVSWTPGQRSLFRKNRNYWESGRPHADELEMLSIPDSTARLDALTSSQIDCMEFLDFTQAKAQASNPNLQLIQAKYGTYTPVYMRVDVPPFSDNNVRTALKLSINRPQALSVALLGYGVVSDDVFGQGTPTYDTALPQRAYDPEQAKALLKKAGHENLTVTLVASTEAPGMLESATAWAQQAASAGITINLHQVPASDLFNTSLYYLKAPFGQTQWTHMTWEENTLQSLLSNSPYNETHWQVRGFDNLFYQAQATLDDNLRTEMFRHLQETIWSQGGYVIWGNQTTIDAASARLKGIVPSPYYDLGRYAFRDYWLA